MSEKFKKALYEAESKNEKMLPQLHKLDDSIESFIQKLEKKINATKDNPVFQRKAHQLLANMSKEHGEFIMALRAVVNALDREGQMIPQEIGKWGVRDVNGGQEEIPEEEPQEKEPVKEATGGHPYGSSDLKFDTSKMKRLIKKDNFLMKQMKQMEQNKSSFPYKISNEEVLFNSYVLGDPVMERKYKKA